MKNAKKVLAMVIVLALAISMAIPVSADAATATIKITNAQVGSTYTIWKMADLIKAGDAYSYTGVPAWKTFFQNNGFTVTDVFDGSYVVDLSGTDLGAEKGRAAVAAGKVIDADGDKQIKATSSTVLFENLAPGYYCVDTEMGTLVAVDTATLDGDGVVVIDDKNTAPTIEKLVNDKVADDVDFGDEVIYTVTVTVGKGAVGYYVVDQMPSGFDFGAIKTAVVMRGAADVTNSITDFSVTRDSDGDFIIAGEENCAVGDKIVFTYSATVTTGAAVDTANTNIATVRYGEYVNKADAFTGASDSASVYTWSFNLTKYTGTDTLLPGATFQIKNSEGQLLYFTQNENTYTYAGIASGTGLTANLTTSTGKYVIKGLDSDEYTITETVAPNGYNKLTGDENLTINAVVDGDGLVKQIPDYNFNGNTEFGVQNNTGAELPSTGGTGTVIFIAVGSFLVLAMGVLLVVRKRMSKVVYTR